MADDKSKQAAAAFSTVVDVIVLAAFYLLLGVLLLAVMRALGILPRAWPSVAPEAAAYLCGAWYLLIGGRRRGS